MRGPPSPLMETKHLYRDTSHQTPTSSLGARHVLVKLSIELSLHIHAAATATGPTSSTSATTPAATLASTVGIVVTAAAAVHKIYSYITSTVPTKSLLQAL